MKVAHMLKRIFIPILILSVFVLGLIPTSSVEAAALSYNDVTRFDDTPQPFALPTTISSDLPCNPEAVHGLFFYRTECPHCQETLDQVIYPLESELGADLDIRLVNIDYAGNYELFIQFQEYFHTAAGDRAIPTLIIGEHIIIGEDAIRAEIDPLVQDGIAAGGIAWTALEGFDPSTIITSTSTDAAGEICSLDSDSCEVGTPIYAAYFYQTGCQECSMVEADLAYLRSSGQFDKHRREQIRKKIVSIVTAQINVVVRKKLTQMVDIEKVVGEIYEGKTDPYTVSKELIRLSAMG